MSVSSMYHELVRPGSLWLIFLFSVLIMSMGGIRATVYEYLWRPELSYILQLELQVAASCLTREAGN